MRSPTTAEKPRIPWARPSLVGREREYVVDALDSTWISGGPYVERLERELPARMGARHGVAVNNGTTALQLALMAVGIGPGDQVIVPGFTFVAAANMVLAVGATPVQADVDPDTWLLDPESFRAAITPATRAVIPVHLYGNVADMDAIGGIARDHGMFVIEDAAEAAFSTHRGRCAGTLGTIGTLSFQATKTLATGEGGMVLTEDAELDRRMRLLRDHGMRRGRRYWHDVVGYNFRLTKLQAAVGCAQIEQIEGLCRERRRVHETYRRCLADDPRFRPQRFADEVSPVLWTFGVRLLPRADLPARDVVMARLLERGIETRPGFHALSDMPPYAGPSLPVASQVSRNVILLPAYPALDDATIAFICEAFTSTLAPSG